MVCNLNPGRRTRPAGVFNGGGQMAGLEIKTDTFRVYPCGKVVHEDDFEAEDNAAVYHDDYETYSVPVEIINYIEERCSVG